MPDTNQPKEAPESGSAAPPCSASDESLMPERDALWAKHDGLTPALAAELLVLAGKLEQERNENARMLRIINEDRDEARNDLAAMEKDHALAFGIADVQQFLIDEHARMMWSIKDLPRHGTGSLTARHKVRGAIDFGITISNWISRKQIELSRQNSVLSQRDVE
jgi:hypothetical protein